MIILLILLKNYYLSDHTLLFNRFNFGKLFLVTFHGIIAMINRYINSTTKSIKRTCNFQASRCPIVTKIEKRENGKILNRRERGETPRKCGGERLEGEPFFSRRSETVERTTVITEGSGKRSERPAQNKMRSHYVRSSKGARGLEQSACNGEHVDCVSVNARARLHMQQRLSTLLSFFLLYLSVQYACVCACECVCIYNEYDFLAFDFLLYRGYS